MEIKIKKKTIYQPELSSSSHEEDVAKYTTVGDALSLFEGIRDITLRQQKYSAVIEIGDWHIQLSNKTFTKRQIKHMKKYFGWEVRNIDES